MHAFADELMRALGSAGDMWARPVTAHVQPIGWLRSQSDLLTCLAGARTRSVTRNPPRISSSADLFDAGADLDVGRTLMIDNAGAANEELGAIGRAISGWLGIDQRSCAMKLSVSPAGSGLFMHFDQHDSIQVQLGGTKVWRLSEGPGVRWPLDPYAVATEPTKELRDYCSSEDLHPRALREIGLSPGDVLTVPRGYWHETHAVTPSVSLIACLAVDSWCDILQPQYRRDAARNAAWREPMYGAWLAGELTRGARNHIRTLIRSSFGGDSSVVRRDLDI